MSPNKFAQRFSLARHQMRVLPVLVALLLLLTCGAALGGDTTTPYDDSFGETLSYRGQPNSLTASWGNIPENASPGSTYAVIPMEVEGSDPLFSGGGPDCGSGLACLSFMNPMPGIYEYTGFMPNVVDELPLKEMRIHGALSLFDEYAGDPFFSYFLLPPEVEGFSEGTFRPATLAPEDPFQFTLEDPFTVFFSFDLELRPNPDFETFFFVIQGAQLRDLTIDTISVVPIPAAAPLFGSAVGLLGLLGWRKKKQSTTVAA